MCRGNKFHSLVKGMTKVLAAKDKAFTVKMRTGIKMDKNIAHSYVEFCRDNGVSAVTVSQHILSFTTPINLIEINNQILYYIVSNFCSCMVAQGNNGIYAMPIGIILEHVLKLRAPWLSLEMGTLCRGTIICKGKQYRMLPVQYAYLLFYT